VKRTEIYLMSDVITIFLIILAEVALVEAIAIFIIIKKRKGATQSVDPDVARTTYKSMVDNSNHKEEVSEILKSLYDIEDEKVEAKLVTILDSEFLIYRTAIKAVATGDCGGIIDSQKKVDGLLENYHSLVRVLKANAEKKVDQLESYNKDLQVDIDKLKLELKTTLTTMESTLSEYANMYAAKAASQEGDEKLNDLTEAVGNARQHADHAMNKADEDAENKRVPIDQAEIDERLAAAEAETGAKESPDSETTDESLGEAETKVEETEATPSEIIFETMGQVDEATEYKQDPASDNSTDNPEVNGRANNELDVPIVDLNIDDDIDDQIKADENDVELDKKAVATEEEISSFLLENNSAEEEQSLNIDDADADIADLLNDANDIDLSEDMNDILDASFDLDSQLSESSKLKTGS